MMLAKRQLAVILASPPWGLTGSPVLPGAAEPRSNSHDCNPHYLAYFLYFRNVK